MSANTTRPRRSPSIPIPQRSASISPTRMSIEEAIPMPFSASRPHITSPDRNADAGSPPVRSYLSGGARVQVIQQTYEPRIVRASDGPCLPSSPTTSSNALPVSPVRANTRRHSSTHAASLTLASTHPHHFSGAPVSPASLTRTRNSSSGTAFPPPSYLNHSALRPLLRTDSPEVLTRTKESNPPAAQAGNRRMSPAPTESDSSDEDRVSSPAPFPTSSADALEPKDLFLPTRWSEDMRLPALALSSDGKDLMHHGPTPNNDKVAAAARTNHPVPPACGIYYYEVSIVSNGSKGHISIGFSGRDVKLARLPGWEKHSWGYHGDDGCSFAAENSGTPFGPPYGVGDVIGCGIDFSQHRAFYTKNGALIGYVFNNIGTSGQDIYPSVGLRHPGEAITANFGQLPFKFDIEYHVSQRREAVWNGIMSSDVLKNIDIVARDSSIGPTTDSKNSDAPTFTVKSKGKGKELDRGPQHVAIEESDEEDGDPAKSGINRIVLDYLLHHGYAKTARAFQTQNISGRKAAQACVTAAAAASTSSSALPSPPSQVETATTSRDHDGDVTMDDAVADHVSSDMSLLLEDDASIDVRTSIVRSVISGDIDSALYDIGRYYPSVLTADSGLIGCKLRCRKFVELTLATNEIGRRVDRDSSRESTRSNNSGHGNGHTSPDAAMDVDEAANIPIFSNGNSRGKRKQSYSPTHDGTESIKEVTRVITPTSVSPPVRHRSPVAAEYEAALTSTITYGQKLRTDYKMDERPEVRTLLKRTFGILAWKNLQDAIGDVAEIVSQDARVALSTEVNQAILVSQGRPARPALETLYRHTSASIKVLGLLGVGEAVFAHLDKELLDA